MLRRWTTRWHHNEPCRQTKDFFPFPRPALAYDIMRSNRVQFSILVQVISGHNFLRYHQFLINNDDDEYVANPQCPLCQKTGSRQTTFHILAKCEALAAQRLMVFGSPFLVGLVDITKQQILGFLDETKIEFLPFEVS